MIPIYPMFAVVAFLPFIVAIPIFYLIKKTILKNDVPTHNPGFTFKRLVAFVILFASYIVPVTILYHFLINKIWW